MRILHIIAGGQHGGAETFFVDLAEALARRSIPQAVVTRSYPERLNRLVAAGCATQTARLGGPLDWSSSRIVKKAIVQNTPDVVLAWMSRAAKFLPRGPWVNVGRIGGYYDLKYFRKCDYLICNTPELVDRCLHQGWHPDRISYIPNFSPTVESAAVSRQDLDTNEDATVLLVLARLEQHKGVDTAIRALTHLPNAVLWIAGTGRQEQQLQNLSRSLGVIERVRFLGWRTDREALLKAADVCLVPSRSEPFGNVIVNAWTNGTPVVAANAEGPTFLIDYEENGLLFEIDDHHGLASCVQRIVNDDVFARRLSIGGQSRANTEFSESAVIDAYVDVFERLVSARIR